MKSPCPAIQPERTVIIGSDGEITAGNVLVGGADGVLAGKRRRVLAHSVPAGIEDRRVLVPNAAGGFAAGVLGIPERVGDLRARAVHGAGKFPDALRWSCCRWNAVPAMRPP